MGPIESGYSMFFRAADCVACGTSMLVMADGTEKPYCTSHDAIYDLAYLAKNAERV